MLRKIIRNLFLFIIAVLAGTSLTTSAFGQASATVSGQVVDPQGASVPNAQVSITQDVQHTTRKTVTNDAGRFEFPFLAPGPYRVQISAEGFSPVVSNLLSVTVGQTLVFDVQLTVGSVQQQITVAATSELLNSSQANIATTVESEEIQSLPLVNRDVMTLLTTIPGFQSLSQAYTFGFHQTELYANGSGGFGSGASNFYLDGSLNMTCVRNSGNALPNPDAVQEFRVVTNSFGAEFGRFPGAVVDAVTKSGSNRFHGSAFEFLRNDHLNATPYLASKNPVLRRNQYGATVGGPIRQDKLFFFGSYAGLRQRTTDFVTGAVVPTTAERNGDFSASNLKSPLIDPTTGVAFSPANIIPQGRVDPVSSAILAKYIPTANVGANGYSFGFIHPLINSEYLAKIDYNINARQQLTFSYFGEPYNERLGTAGNIPWHIRTSSSTQQNYNVSYVTTISNTVVNQAKAGYIRNFGTRATTPSVSLTDLGSTFVTVGDHVLPQISISGYFSTSSYLMGPRVGSDFYTVRDTVIMNKGRHSLKIGYEGYLEKDLQYSDLANFGAISFDGSKTKSNAFADFLLGTPLSFQQAPPSLENVNAFYHGPFVQDDWKIIPRLTINLGLRYDLALPGTDNQNRKMIFLQGAQSTVSPNSLPYLLYPGDKGVPRGAYLTDFRKFAPRIGFALQPTRDGKTSVRAGFGVFYGVLSLNNEAQAENNQPFTQTFNPSNPGPLSNPYANLASVPNFRAGFSFANPTFILPAVVEPEDTNLRSPYVYQINAAIQHQFGEHTVVTVAYVGALSHKLPNDFQVNYPVYQPGATSATADQRRPILPGILGSVLVLKSIVNSSYNGLQVTAEKRFANGFALRGYYVYSKTLDGANTQQDNTGNSPQDFRDLAAEHGRSVFDARNNAVLTGTWEINPISSGGRFERGLLNGWTLSAIGTLTSGIPFSILTGKNNKADGVSTDRPNLVSGVNPVLDHHRSVLAVRAAWFNTAAFVQNGPGQDGNVARDPYDAPGYRDVDAGLSKDVHAFREALFQFRAEFTNVFNMVSLSAPNGTLTSTSFGKITGGAAMRQGQVGVRLT